MKRNQLLYLAFLLGKAISVMLIVGLVLLVITFIHWHLNSDFYKSVQLTVDQSNINFLEGRAETVQPAPPRTSDSYSTGGPGGKRAFLNDLTPFSIYFIFFQLFLSVILSYYIVREVMGILKSVLELHPFNTANIRSFRRIGYLCLSVMVLNSFHFLITAQTSFINFSINYALLIFMLITFILAEIFKEGQKLYEQDKLTI